MVTLDQGAWDLYDESEKYELIIGSMSLQLTDASLSWASYEATLAGKPISLHLDTALGHLLMMQGIDPLHMLVFTGSVLTHGVLSGTYAVSFSNHRRASDTSLPLVAERYWTAIFRAGALPSL